MENLNKSTISTTEILEHNNALDKKMKKIVFVTTIIIIIALECIPYFLF